MKLNRHVAVLFGCAALMGGIVAGCGGDDEDSGGADAARRRPARPRARRSSTPRRWTAPRARSPTARARTRRATPRRSIEGFNKKYEAQGLSAKLVEFPADADQQRQQFVQRQEAKSGECDVFSSDVVWTAEFANQKWLYDMTPYVEARKDEFIPATLGDHHLRRQELGRAGHVRRGVHLLPHRPGQGGARRRGRTSTRTPRKKDGIVYQGAAYEGLTCDFLEIAFAAGGKVLSDDGKKAEFDSPENLKALQFMVDGIKDGAAPKAVTTYMEEESRRAFETGDADVHAQLAVRVRRRQEEQERAGVRGRAVPGVRGRRQGRHPRRPQQGHLGVLEEPGRRARACRLPHEPRSDQIEMRSEYSLPPALSAAYDDPKVKKALPFSDRAQAGDRAGQVAPGLAGLPADLARRSTRTSTRRSRARSRPEEALKTGQSQMEQALATF